MKHLILMGILMPFFFFANAGNGGNSLKHEAILQQSNAIKTTKQNAILQRIMAINHQCDLAKNTAGKTNATVYYKIGQRHDTYDANSMLWNYTDSSNYYFDGLAHDSLENDLVYHLSSSEWLNNTRVLYTFTGNNVSTYLYQNWDNASSSWVNSTKTIFTYTSIGYTDTWINQGWDNATNNWKNDSKGIYTYNSDNNQLTYIEQSWNDVNNNWLNTKKMLNAYDANGNLTSYTNLSWNDPSSSFINVDKYSFAYDANNIRIQRIHQIWDIGSNNWVNHYRYQDSNDSNNYYLGFIYQEWNAGNSSWDNVQKLVLTYDGSYNNTQRLYQSWQSASSSWLNLLRQDYTYDSNNNQTSFIEYYWDNASSSYSHPNQKNTWSFNVDNTLNQYEHFEWSTTNSRLDPVHRDTHEYDFHQNETHVVNEDYDASSHQYAFTDQYYYYYQAFTVSGIEETANINNMSMYPNPATGGQAIVSFNLKADATIAINMYDINGRLVGSQTNQFAAGDNKASIETGTLSPGIYQVQWVNLKDNSVASLKLLVQ